MNALQLFGWTPEQFEQMDRAWQLYALAYTWKTEREALKDGDTQ